MTKTEFDIRAFRIIENHLFEIKEGKKDKEEYTEFIRRQIAE